jgi:hypothetical protein
MLMIAILCVNKYKQVFVTDNKSAHSLIGFVVYGMCVGVEKIKFFRRKCLNCRKRKGVVLLNLKKCGL